MDLLDRLDDLTPERVRPLKRVEYEKLIDAGCFGDEHIELLAGFIVEKSDRRARATSPPPVAHPRTPVMGQPMNLLDHLDDLWPERVRPLKRVEYEKLVEMGCFVDEHVEFLAGFMVEMSATHPPHSDVVRQLGELFGRMRAEGVSVCVHAPFGASEDSLPESDLALFPAAESRTGHPNEAFLIVEVALESLRKDRTIKSELYARAGIPEYWIVNLVENVVEIYTTPRAGAYETFRTVGLDGRIRLAAPAQIDVAVADFLK